MNKVIKQVTKNIAERSAKKRNEYLMRVRQQAALGKGRATFACGNLAHTVASCSAEQKSTILDFTRVNIGIITAYNDMLSAHQPYKTYPDQIKSALQKMGHSAQVAGGVPAMCDGVTQGQIGMDLSLFSRDLIAQATVIGLSHNTFDATLLLGVCDKIAPGQIMGALAFGHLPAAFVPSGPMPTGISNDHKVKVRQQYAAGEVDKATLQTMENEAYHSPGTCTFYGTANTNQLVFEAMGLMLPGSAFLPPNSPLRHALTDAVATHMVSVTHGCKAYRPIAEVIDERTMVNGLVALLASGGSTNHTIHMIAIARAAGLTVTWDDFDQLSNVVPSLTMLYPNGPADINAFQAAGGVPTLMKQLFDRGLLNMDATPLYGTMQDYLTQPILVDDKITFIPATDSLDDKVISAPQQQFSTQGGLKLLDGNLGRGVIKISAVANENRFIEAPAMVFESQHDVQKAYQAGQLNHDVAVVVRHNGPAANGMPELHMLMPILANVMKAGHKVVLVTDGRLSGASGKVPAAIHMTPEAQYDGPLSKIQDGDIICLDANNGSITVKTDIGKRVPSHPDLQSEHVGAGRELFSLFRNAVSSAENGATILN
ncbi:phosphogluconate dehydratase [Psychromonas hadalis]|uniref:phosphogluconate dehydratase n=1 Tax=Psychromonas hadalis TaxID=211669 RepID=UPI0003B7A15C|nr:phosphogluconate dehydratase [Psychromonas hadalis]